MFNDEDRSGGNAVVDEEIRCEDVLEQRLRRTETSPTWQSVRSQDSGFSDSCESSSSPTDNSPDFNVYQVYMHYLF